MLIRIIIFVDSQQNNFKKWSYLLLNYIILQSISISYLFSYHNLIFCENVPVLQYYISTTSKKKINTLCTPKAIHLVSCASNKNRGLVFFVGELLFENSERYEDVIFVSGERLFNLYTLGDSNVDGIVLSYLGLFSLGMP